MTGRDVGGWAIVLGGIGAVYYFATRSTPTATPAPSSGTATSASTPAIPVNQYLAQPSPPPGSSLPVPSGISLPLTRLTAAPVVGEPVQVEAVAQGLAAYNQQLIAAGQIGVGQFGADWVWTVHSPSGSIVQHLAVTGGTTNIFTFVPSSPGTWTVGATVTVNGAQTGPGTITIPVGATILSTGSVPG